MTMSILSVNNLTCIQGVKTLFENISFSIEANEKMAIIGVNGSGKSTLLATVASSLSEPNPAIAMQQGLRVTYLGQTPRFNPDDKIQDHLFRTHTPTAQAIKTYHECLEQLQEDPSSEHEKQLNDAMVQMDLLQAWAYEERITSILNELNIHQLSQKMGTLSGGMIKKIELARLFFEEADLLILDEPTNHLDIDTINWLENKLKRINAAVLMVTHDRYFLDKICTRIIEIDQQSLFIYKGNYSVFLELREQRYSQQKKEEQDIKTALRVELEWLKRGPKARSTKQKARKDRIEDMQNRKTFTQDNALELGVQGRRMGKKILDLKNISKTFDTKRVVNHFSYAFQEGEKIGMLGPNGTGKTTLLNLIAQRLDPDTGIVDAGQNTVFGYFEQHADSFDFNLSIHDHVKQIGQNITLHDGTVLTAAKLLERFLFPSSSLHTQIGKLSGGERRRLQLVCMLLKNPNFLLFDEPTNDLDILTLSVLENFLLTFKGCVIVISHDRYFMDRVVDHLLIFKGNGDISHFVGSYTDYADSLKEDAKAEKKGPSLPVKPAPVEPPAPAKKQLSYKEQQEFKKLEQYIEELENEKTKLTEIFSQPGTPEDYEKVGKRLKDIATQLELNYTRWEYLAQLA